MEPAKEYKQAWQTWTMVRPNGGVKEDAVGAITERVKFRQRVQQARIEQRLSVADLAAQSRCDIETLAAFERGDEVLSPEVQKRLRALLGL